MINDPHASLRDKVLRTVLRGPGEMDRATRANAAADANLPHDADLARLGGSYGDDHLFEIVVSAALGASQRRLQAGLDALNEA